MAGEDAPPAIEPSPRDKRFKDPEWKTNKFFDFVMPLYLLTTQWAHELVKNAEGVDPHPRKKAEFYVQQITNAIAPSNFVFTNPEVCAKRWRSNGDNLVSRHEDAGGRHRGRTRHAAHPPVRSLQPRRRRQHGDDAGQGDLPERADAADPVHADHETVLRTPLLIVPPWINKFYILDLKPEKSYIKWCVDQGTRCVVISWVNPDKELGKRLLTTT